MQSSGLTNRNRIKGRLGTDDSAKQEEVQCTRIPYSRCGGYGMKVIVLTRGGLQGTLPASKRSKLCRKAAVELAEVSSAQSTEEAINDRGGMLWEDGG